MALSAAALPPLVLLLWCCPSAGPDGNPAPEDSFLHLPQHTEPRVYDLCKAWEPNVRKGNDKGKTGTKPGGIRRKVQLPDYWCHCCCSVVSATLLYAAPTKGFLLMFGKGSWQKVSCQCAQHH
jgi:hypothetical protein